MVDGLGETSRCIVGKALSVRFEGVLECVGHVVGFAELGALDCSCLNVVVRDMGARGGEGEQRGGLLSRTPFLLPGKLAVSCMRPRL